MSENLKELQKQLQWRYATKKFDPSKKLSEDDFQGLLEVLRLTPSSFGLQLWKFVVIRNPELRKQLMEKAHQQAQIVDASHLILLCRYTTFESSMVDGFVERVAQVRGQDVSSLQNYRDFLQSFAQNLPEPAEPWMEKQVYIALGFLLEACAVAQIDACPMEGFDRDAWDQILGLPQRNLRAVVACPVGFRSEDDPYHSAPKVRYSQSAVILDEF